MLTLRKVTGHVHADNAYRVIYDGVEVGSIGLQETANQRRFWSWGLDSILPEQRFKTYGEARDRDDAMAQFKVMWGVFISDPDRLVDFMEMKRKRHSD